MCYIELGGFLLVDFRIVAAKEERVGRSSRRSKWGHRFSASSAAAIETEDIARTWRPRSCLGDIISCAELRAYPWIWRNRRGQVILLVILEIDRIFIFYSIGIICRSVDWLWDRFALHFVSRKKQLFLECNIRLWKNILGSLKLKASWGALKERATLPKLWFRKRSVGEVARLFSLFHFKLYDNILIITIIKVRQQRDIEYLPRLKEALLTVITLKPNKAADVFERKTKTKNFPSYLPPQSVFIVVWNMMNIHLRKSAEKKT